MASGTLMGIENCFTAFGFLENMLLAVNVLKQWVFPAWEGILPHLGHFGGSIAHNLNSELYLLLLPEKSKNLRHNTTTTLKSVSSFTNGSGSYYSEGSRLAFAWFKQLVLRESI